MSSKNELLVGDDDCEKTFDPKCIFSVKRHGQQLLDRNDQNAIFPLILHYPAEKRVSPMIFKRTNIMAFKNIEKSF